MNFFDAIVVGSRGTVGKFLTDFLHKDGKNVLEIDRRVNELGLDDVTEFFKKTPKEMPVFLALPSTDFALEYMKRIHNTGKEFTVFDVTYLTEEQYDELEEYAKSVHSKVCHIYDLGVAPGLSDFVVHRFIKEFQNIPIFDKETGRPVDRSEDKYNVGLTVGGYPSYEHKDGHFNLYEENGNDAMYNQPVKIVQFGKQIEVAPHHVHDVSCLDGGIKYEQNKGLVEFASNDLRSLLKLQNDVSIYLMRGSTVRTRKFAELQGWCKPIEDNSDPEYIETTIPVSDFLFKVSVTLDNVKNGYLSTMSLFLYRSCCVENTLAKSTALTAFNTYLKVEELQRRLSPPLFNKQTPVISPYELQKFMEMVDLDDIINDVISNCNFRKIYTRDDIGV